MSGRYTDADPEGCLGALVRAAGELFLYGIGIGAAAIIVVGGAGYGIYRLVKYLMVIWGS